MAKKKSRFEDLGLEDLGLEDDAASEVPAELPEEKCDFDAWFALREKHIPRQHHREIVLADFKGRGLSRHESIEKFDAALRKYGVKFD